MFIHLLQSEQPTSTFDLDVIWNSIFGMVNALLYRLPYIIAGLLVFLLFLVVARLTNRAINAAGERTRLDLTLARLLGRLASLVIAILGILVAAVVVFPAFQPGDLIAGLGLTSVAVGFAFKDVLQNFFAGILILWRKPFVVGDQIEFQGFDGTVEEINVRSTRIRTLDGERAVIPNGIIYTNSILVRTAFEHRRSSLVVGIGYPDSIEKARSAILSLLKKTQGVLNEPMPSVHVIALASSSVDLKVQFWTKSQNSEVRLTSDRVVTGIKLALDEANIDMPYPHSVVLFKDSNGSRTEGTGRANV